MAWRTCRYPPCGKTFAPAKPNHWHCSWDHYLLDKERKGQPLYDLGYRDGYAAGYEAGRRQATIPEELFRPLVSLIHPDRYQGTALVCAANTCLRWVLEHRPPAEAERN
jgi:hypothetical protein